MHSIHWFLRAFLNTSPTTSKDENSKGQNYADDGSVQGEKKYDDEYV